MASYFGVEAAPKKTPVTPEWVDVADDLSDTPKPTDSKPADPKPETKLDDKVETDSLPPLVDDEEDPNSPPTTNLAAKQQLLDLCEKHHLPETAKLIPKLNQKRLADLINEYMTSFGDDVTKQVIIGKLITTEKKESTSALEQSSKPVEPVVEKKVQPIVFVDPEPVPMVDEASFRNASKVEETPAPVRTSALLQDVLDGHVKVERKEPAPQPKEPAPVLAPIDLKAARKAAIRAAHITPSTPSHAILLNDKLVPSKVINKYPHCTEVLTTLCKCDLYTAADIKFYIYPRDLINIDQVQYLIDLHKTSSLPRTIQAVVQVSAVNLYEFNARKLYAPALIEYFHNWLVERYSDGEWKNVIEFHDGFLGYDVHAKLPFVKKPIVIRRG